MSEIIAAIDQGTTSSRCMLFDKSGKIISAAQQEHRQIYPLPGWVEHDPMEIWQKTQYVIEKALQSGRVASNAIKAVGVTNQRETTVAWDKFTGRPLYNAIVWQDTRTKDICEQLISEAGSEMPGIDRFRSITGLPVSTYFAATKIIWLINHGPSEIREGLNSGSTLFGTMDSWLIWWLTGGPEGGSHVTDVTNASRTQLMNLYTLDWDDHLLDIHGIPRTSLPRITSSSDPDSWGSTRKSGPFGAEIPVCGNLGDQHAALVGQACLNEGDLKNTYGTGCFLLLNTGTRAIQSKQGLLTTLAYKFGDMPPIYALEGSIAIAGALVQWLRDNLGIIHASTEIEALASEVADNGGVYFVPAFSGLFAPYWRADARGTITGLTRFVNKRHLARAVLEATAFQSRDVLKAMERETGVSIQSLKVDGGMVENDLLMQFQADILDIPVIRPRIKETTSLGAAYAAGLAVGLWHGTQAIEDVWQAGHRWVPDMNVSKRAHLLAKWSLAIEKSFGWEIG